MTLFCDVIFLIHKDGDSAENLKSILGLDEGEKKELNDFAADFLKRTVFCVRNPSA